MRDVRMMDQAVLEFSPPFLVSADERAEYLAFAKAVAVEAGLATLPYFRTTSDIMGVENKAAEGFDPVTVADREAEAVIRERIKQTYPNHGIYGEEFGLEPGCGLTWVIDPIDGTRAFMSG
ncbi:MAG: inositol monophosphatase family protein, partial [Pseudomonadales bacterium]